MDRMEGDSIMVYNGVVEFFEDEDVKEELLGPTSETPIYLNLDGIFGCKAFKNNYFYDILHYIESMLSDQT